jgi:hypothetical protein
MTQLGGEIWTAQEIQQTGVFCKQIGPGLALAPFALNDPATWNNFRPCVEWVAICDEFTTLELWRNAFATGKGSDGHSWSFKWEIVPQASLCSTLTEAWNTRLQAKQNYIELKHCRQCSGRRFLFLGLWVPAGHNFQTMGDETGG